MTATQVERAHLDISGGRTIVDIITESLLGEFSEEHGLSHLGESKRFEHFASHLIIGGEQSETFDTADVVVGDGSQTKGGSDTGIDAIAVIVNGDLIVDVEELTEQADRVGFLDVEFVFIQAETGAGFEAAKIGTLRYGVTDFFRDVPLMNRNDKDN